MSTTAAVRVEKLTRRFGERIVLDALDLTIAPGEFVAMLGRSGSGKSTLLRAIAGIDHDAAAEERIVAPARRAVLFQDARLLPWARVIDNVLLGTDSPEGARRAKGVLAEVGLAGREAEWPKNLSGGEQQRVALARSLVREPELLLADEPFSALDALTKIQMQDLLAIICRKHAPSVLLVTHDVEEAIMLADRVVLLDAGQIALDRRVATPRPRHRGGPEFEALRDELFARLGVEAGRTLPVQPQREPAAALATHH
ncbi:ABC transporter ATP-binding protein [Bosea sp. BK604]|uniref:ABC transporter ATP-binding protein n=1 Tax=Bosea sp. BK604 TaxID=2512180 RepID=UPI0010517873|nr:ABC transporter ATP-binding protein [Bosea sp. BK604]TCR61548.1 sulfonate transport system ATP-binding protein [Bosea sp. BK604]